MADLAETPPGTIVRVVLPGLPAFQLRKDERGISVFDPGAVDPPLTEQEILDGFRAGSQAVMRSVNDLEAQGLQLIPVEGADILPERLRQAHREIRPGPEMTRDQFKRALRELE